MYRSTVPTRQVINPRDGEQFAVPDFATIVPITSCEDPECEGCDSCESAWWTPRTADLLHGATEFMIAIALDITGLRDFDGSQPAAYHDLEWVTKDLPRSIAAQADAQWVARFIGCYTDLLHRMEDGQLPRPRCTAEEMALHLILARAEDRVAEYGIDDATNPDEEMLHHVIELQNELPRTSEDYDFLMLREGLFEDGDVLMMFEPQLDGIEHDEAITAQMGLVNLKFKDWFTPFRADLDVAPLSAGFERDHESGDRSPQGGTPLDLLASARMIGGTEAVLDAPLATRKNPVVRVACVVELEVADVSAFTANLDREAAYAVCDQDPDGLAAVAAEQLHGQLQAPLRPGCVLVSESLVAKLLRVEDGAELLGWGPDVHVETFPGGLDRRTRRAS